MRLLADVTIAASTIAALESHAEDLLQGAVVIVDEATTRVRKLPLTL